MALRHLTPALKKAPSIQAGATLLAIFHKVVSVIFEHLAIWTQQLRLSNQVSCQAFVAAPATAAGVRYLS